MEIKFWCTCRFCWSGSFTGRFFLYKYVSVDKTGNKKHVPLPHTFECALQISLYHAPF